MRLHRMVHGKTLTLTAAIRVGSVSAWAVFDRAINRLWFESYIDRLLVLTLSKGDVVIMDNLPTHKSATVVKAIEEASA
jgi:transposase